MQGMHLVILDKEIAEDEEGNYNSQREQEAEMAKCELVATTRSIVRLQKVHVNLEKPLLLGIDEFCWEIEPGQAIGLSVAYQQEVTQWQPIERRRYYLLKPVEQSDLDQLLATVPRQRREGLTAAEQERINSVCLRVGIPAHIQGYAYIRKAIGMVLLEPEAINGITKVLYPGVAAWFGTTPSKVERSIRHAVTTIWKKGHAETINELFGYRVCSTAERPTNGGFIALMAELCREKDD